MKDKKRRKERKEDYYAFDFSMAKTALIAIMTAAGATNATM